MEGIEWKGLNGRGDGERERERDRVRIKEVIESEEWRRSIVRRDVEGGREVKKSRKVKEEEKRKDG
jgi:hypothetical protein